MADKLTSNVYVLDPETGEGKWYGPDYPKAGAPPAGSVTNPAAFAEPEPDPLDPRQSFDGVQTHSSDTELGQERADDEAEDGQTSPRGARRGAGNK